jgi:hypothetical protein
MSPGVPAHLVEVVRLKEELSTWIQPSRYLALTRGGEDVMPPGVPAHLVEVVRLKEELSTWIQPSRYLASTEPLLLVFRCRHTEWLVASWCLMCALACDGVATALWRWH